MRANCVICSDFFDEINPISTAPCGHVYHSTCLTLWMDQSKSCPQCRSRMVLKDILRLYFNFSPKTDLNTSDLENERLNLKSELSAKDLELANLRKNIEDLKVYVREAEKKASEQQQARYKSDAEIADLRMRVKTTSKLEAKILKLEQMNLSLTNDLQSLNNVQTIVNGTQKDVESILKEYSDHSEASKQLATYCTCLKRELQKVIESKDKLVDLTTKLKQENAMFAAKVKFFEEAMCLSNDSQKTPLHMKKAAYAMKSSPLVSSENTPSTSKQSATKADVEISPLSVEFNKKFNMSIKSCTFYRKDTSCENTLMFTNKRTLPVTAQNDDSSIIRTGYNGLGGHGKFIARSGIKKLKTIKK